MEPVGRKSSSLSADGEFEVLPPPGEVTVRNEEALSALRSFFGRKVVVSTGSPAQSVEPLPKKEFMPVTRSRLLRNISSLFNPAPDQRHKTGGNGAEDSEKVDKHDYDQWEMVSDNQKPQLISGAGVEESPNGRVIVVGDGELVQALNKKTFASLPVDENSILPPVLSLKDISQSDQRSTCYILSVAAAYAVSEPGRKALKEMFTDKGDGVGLVKLYDEILNEEVFVQVSLNRIFVNNKSIYSYSSQGRAWPSTLEKSVHGLNLAYAQAWAEKKQTLSEGDARELRSELSSVLTTRDRAKLDFDNLASAMKRLPAVEVGVKDAVPGVQIIRITQESLFQDCIISSLQAGVPVILGTQKISECSETSAFKQIKNVLKTGTPTGHAMAVLKTHEVKGKGGIQSGILVFDPYGEKKGPIPSEEEMKSDFFNPSANGPVQFVPWEQVLERFSDACFAKGAPRLSA